jgi:hypothetical protein
MIADGERAGSGSEIHGSEIHRRAAEAQRKKKAIR